MKPFRVCVRGALAAVAAAAALVVTAVPAAGAATTSGSVDTTFGAGGFATVPFGQWSAASAVAVQASGAIVTAGQTQAADGTNAILVTQMLPSGALDPSFGSGGTQVVTIGASAGDDSGAALGLQSNGDILVAGSGTDAQGRIDFAVVRLLPNGQRDASFGADGVVTIPIGTQAMATAVAVQSNGRILVGGGAQIGGQTEFAAVRLTANGALDTSFGSRGIATVPNPGAYAWGLVLQSNGDVVLGGQEAYGPAGSNNSQFMVARLTATGTADRSFGSGGVVSLPVGSTAYGYALAIQPKDQKLLIAGPAYTTTGVAATARLNPNGTLDTTFGSRGIAAIPDWNGAQAIALQPNGQIVLASTGATAVRLNANGSADAAFGTGGIATAQDGTSSTAANGVAVQPDGSLLLAGATTVNGANQAMVTRLFG
jgi:uncharacterized delta-60 repeat protein